MNYKITLWLIKKLIARAKRIRMKAKRKKCAMKVVLPQLQAKQSSLEESLPPILVMESFFAHSLIQNLTKGRNEEMTFLTGPKIGPIRIVARMADPVALEQQSPVFVRATAKSVADVLIPIVEWGSQLHLVAHSHPGHGEHATIPSSTDTECLGKLQRSGSSAVGCIVTRDGYIRFFSVLTMFHVMVLGAGVKEVSKNVFKIEHQN